MEDGVKAVFLHPPSSLRHPALKEALLRLNLFLALDR